LHVYAAFFQNVRAFSAPFVVACPVLSLSAARVSLPDSRKSPGFSVQTACTLFEKS